MRLTSIEKKSDLSSSATFRSAPASTFRAAPAATHPLKPFHGLKA